MLRVLHLFGSEDAPTPGRTEAFLPAAGTGVEFVTCRIGRGGDFRSVVDAALSLRCRQTGVADLIHAWDGAALIAAIASGKPVVFSASATAGSNCRRLTWVKRFPQVDVVCETAAERDIWIRQGLDFGRCHVIRPARSIDAVDARGRAEIRQRLGIVPEDFVLLAPGESSYAADHRLAVHVASILHVLDPRFRVLLSGRGPQTRSAAELGQRLKQTRVVICAEQLRNQVGFESLTAAADVALVTARAVAPVWPWVMCLAAALPIISLDNRQTREVFGDNAASFVEPAGPRTLAHRVLELSEKPMELVELARSAAIRAQTLFPLDGMIRDFQSLYLRLARPKPATLREDQRDSKLSRMTVTGPSLTR